MYHLRTAADEEAPLRQQLHRCACSFLLGDGSRSSWMKTWEWSRRSLAKAILTERWLSGTGEPTIKSPTTMWLRWARSSIETQMSHSRGQDTSKGEVPTIRIHQCAHSTPQSKRALRTSIHAWLLPWESTVFLAKVEEARHVSAYGFCRLKTHSKNPHVTRSSQHLNLLYCKESLCQVCRELCLPIQQEDS